MLLLQEFDRAVVCGRRSRRRKDRQDCKQVIGTTLIPVLRAGVSINKQAAGQAGGLNCAQGGVPGRHQWHQWHQAPLLLMLLLC